MALRRTRWFTVGALLASLPFAWMSAADALENFAVGVPQVARTSGLQFDRAKIAGLERHLMVAKPQAQDPDPAMVASAARVLRHDPLNPAAIWIVANRKGNSSAQRFEGLQLGERVTRRDLATQLQTMRFYAERDNMKVAMDHFDTAMTVYGDGPPDVLISAANALAAPEFRAMLATYRSKTWFKRMMSVAMSQGVEPAGVGRLILEKNLGSDVIDIKLLPTLLGNLVAKGETGLASQVAGKFGWDQARLGKSFGLSMETTEGRFSPLAWSVLTLPAVETSLNSDSQVLVGIAAESHGQIMSRATTLPSGNYVLEMDAGLDESAAAQVDLQWTLECYVEIQWVQSWQKQIKLTGKSTNYQMNLTIPESCSQQLWTLSGSSSGTQSTANIDIGSLGLNRQ